MSRLQDDVAHKLASTLFFIVGHVAIIVAPGVVALPGSVAAQDLVVPVGTTVTIASDSTVNNADVAGTLVVDGALTVQNDMTVFSGGIVTHTLRNVEGLRLVVIGTLEVRSGGLIDLNMKGLRGGKNGWSGLHGETLNGALIVDGARGGSTGAGASHGGVGANSESGSATNAAYGQLDEAGQVGSGGGGSTGSGVGGHGGGRATIVSGTFRLDGTLRANGGNGTNVSGVKGGGGSGGGIRLQVGTLTTVGSGAIQAIGGRGSANSGSLDSGSGGGGRIAIFYDTLDFPLTRITARGSKDTPDSSNTQLYGSAGTIYLKDNASSKGDLVIDNGGVGSVLYTPYRSSIGELRSLSVASSGRLTLVSSDLSVLSVDEGIPLTGASIVGVGSGVTLAVGNASGFDINVQSGSTLVLNAGSALAADQVRVNASTLSTSIDLAFPGAGDFELSGAGIVNLLGSAVLSLGTFDTANFQSGTVNLTSNGRLDVSSNEATIGAGVTVIKDGGFGPSGDEIGNLTVESGGVVTHTLRNVDGLHLVVTGMLEVQSGGLIDLNVKGLRGGKNGWAGLHGETLNGIDIVDGARGGSTGAGASYGGVGANSESGSVTNAVYGLLDEAGQVGSGGGGSTGSGVGGHGGGRASIVVGGTFVLDGTLRANGGNGTNVSGAKGGGGSGGGIRLQVGTLTTVGTGAIQAIGARGYADSGSLDSGSGGGGRIAIFYDTLDFPLTRITARGSKDSPDSSNTQLYGSAGTIYLKDNASSKGDLVIDNGGVASVLYTPFRSSIGELRSLSVASSGRLTLVSSDLSVLSVDEGIPLTGASIVGVGSGVTLAVGNASGFDINVQSGSTLVLNAGSALAADQVRVNASTLSTSIDLAFPGAGDFELSGAGSLNLLGSAVLSLGTFDTANFQSGTVNLTSNGRLDVSSNEATIGTGVTVIKDGRFGPSGDEIGNLTVESSGVVTHTLRNVDGLHLVVTATLEVQSGGLIDLNMKGLRGGKNGWTGLHGETLNGMDIVDGARGGSTGAGASYGGVGANSESGSVTNAVYGLLDEAGQVGSGGGGSTGSGVGGHGGGRASIVVGGTFVLDGTLRANGGNGTNVSGAKGGGGSGGGIRLQVGTLTTVGSGAIQAIGARGYADSGSLDSGSGGGGRIAIFYDTLDFPLTRITARGSKDSPDSSNTQLYGSAGTIYLKDNASSKGDLVIDNGGVASVLYTPYVAATATLRNLALQDRGGMLNRTPISIANLTVTTSAALSVGASATVTDSLFVGHGGVLVRQ